MGLVPPREGFLELLREQADACGALLILDEVISGFRVARGGAQELTGVHGDLTILGKVLGGGLPAAAVGGRAELMRLLAPAGEVYQAGTLSGNPLAVAAGLATLALLDEPAYLRLSSLTDQLAAGLRAAAAARGAAGSGRQCSRSFDRLLQRSSRCSTSPTRARAIWMPMQPGAGSCSRAGSTPRPRSSRPGFRRSLTRPSRSNAPLPPPPPPSRSFHERAGRATVRPRQPADPRASPCSACARSCSARAA